MKSFHRAILASLAGLVILITATVSPSCKKAPSGPYREAALKAGAWVRASGEVTTEGLSWRSGIPEEETPGFWNNAGICCGLAGVGEFFLDLYGALGDASYLEFSRRVTARLLAKATAENDRMFWVQAEHRTRPDHVLAQTGYMQGAAGIGTFLLRLAAVDGAKKKRIILPDTPFMR